VIRICGHLRETEADLNAHVAELMRRPRGALELLPAWSDIGDARDGITFVRYRKTLSDGRLEVVVQAYRPNRRLLFVEVGQIAAEGFWALPDGSIERMPQGALYDYT
jgi:hypothetical protein